MVFHYTSNSGKTRFHPQIGINESGKLVNLGGHYAGQWFSPADEFVKKANAILFNHHACLNRIFNMLLLNMKAMIAYVAMLDESDHAVQNASSGLDRLKRVLVFSADDRACVDTVIRKSAICKVQFQSGDWSRDVNSLIMEYHGDDVIRRAKIIRSEVSAFIDEDAKFAHRVIPPDIRIAGNIPALDGPGSFDQPQSVS